MDKAQFALSIYLPMDISVISTWGAEGSAEEMFGESSACCTNMRLKADMTGDIGNPMLRGRMGDRDRRVPKVPEAGSLGCEVLDKRRGFKQGGRDTHRETFKNK